MAYHNLKLHPSDFQLIFIVEQVYMLVKVLILLSNNSKKEHHYLLKKYCSLLKLKKVSVREIQVLINGSIIFIKKS